MPLLRDVLNWCIEVNENMIGNDKIPIQLMLDIKTDNDPIKLYGLIFELFNELKGIDYWKDKIIFGIWRWDFYIYDNLKDFKVINITFDIQLAKSFYNKVLEIEPNAKIHGISIINMIIYRENECNELINWIRDNELKLWFWTVNDNIELQKIIKLCEEEENGNVSLLEGIITDDPIAVLDEQKAKLSVNWKSNLKWWVKVRIYSWFLYLSRRGYNLRTVFAILKRIGFV